ncbi:hypothetical protein pipiens_001792 [Culex pipiens pipiens]|uniref:Uncharacterized protein n=1 Tax=Culex pipiens pipiens TaxID=38569 RepID=A0ABD1DUF5_CULPP
MVTAGFDNDTVILPSCKHKYGKMHYGVMPLELLTMPITLAIHNALILDRRQYKTILGDYLDFTSLQFVLHRVSNHSALLFISCKSNDPETSPLPYYSAFIIHKSLRFDSRPHCYWIRRVNLTDTTDPAFPARWQRVQLASNVDFTRIRLQVCTEAALFLDTDSEYPDAYGCSSTDPRGVPRETDRGRFERNGRLMIHALEKAELANARDRIKRSGVVATGLLLGLVSCAAVVRMVLLLKRSTQLMQYDKEDWPFHGRDSPSGTRLVLVKHNAAPTQFSANHI